MLIALALAVSLATVEVTELEDGCRLIRHIPAKHAHKPVKTLHKALVKPKPEEEVLCDSPVPKLTAALPAAPTYTPIPEEAIEPMLPVDLVDKTFAEASETPSYGTVTYDSPYPVPYPVVYRPLAPVPEPSTWVLLLAGLALLWRRKA